MRNYELTIVLPGDNPETKLKTTLSSVEKLVSSLGGKVEKTDAWGKRDLMYPIRKKADGVYYFMQVSMPADQVSVLNREVELNDEVLRHLLVLEEKGTVVPSEKVEEKPKAKITKKTK